MTYLNKLLMTLIFLMLSGGLVGYLTGFFFEPQFSTSVHQIGYNILWMLWGAVLPSAMNKIWDW